MSTTCRRRTEVEDDSRKSRDQPQTWTQDHRQSLARYKTHIVNMRPHDSAHFTIDLDIGPPLQSLARYRTHIVNMRPHDSAHFTIDLDILQSVGPPLEPSQVQDSYCNHVTHHRRTYCRTTTRTQPVTGLLLTSHLPCLGSYLEPVRSSVPSPSQLQAVLRQFRPKQAHSTTWGPNQVSCISSIELVRTYAFSYFMFF